MPCVTDFLLHYTQPIMGGRNRHSSHVSRGKQTIIEAIVFVMTCYESIFVVPAMVLVHPSLATADDIVVTTE